MNNKILYNQKNKAECLKLLKKETFRRETISFYKYTKINNLQKLRDNLFLSFVNLNILGRIYLAKEGINAQISIPIHNIDGFLTILSSNKSFQNILIKTAYVEGISFLKLNDGGYYIFILSDDNFNFLQKTLLYQFYWDSKL